MLSISKQTNAVYGCDCEYCVGKQKLVLLVGWNWNDWWLEIVFQTIFGMTNSEHAWLFSKRQFENQLKLKYGVIALVAVDF